MSSPQRQGSRPSSARSSFRALFSRSTSQPSSATTVSGGSSGRSGPSTMSKRGSSSSASLLDSSSPVSGGSTLSSMDLESGWRLITSRGIDRLLSVMDQLEVNDHRTSLDRASESSAKKKKVGLSNQEFAMVYTTVYNLCLQKYPRSYDSTLYERYTSVLTEFLTQQSKPVIFDSSKHGAFMLQSLVSEYRKYKFLVRWMSEAFSYLDRSYCRRKHQPLLRIVATTKFREIIFSGVKRKCLPVALALVEKDRDYTNHIDLSVYSSAMDASYSQLPVPTSQAHHSHLFGEADSRMGDSDKVDRTVLRDFVTMFIDVGSRDHKVYARDFEQAYLNETTTYYKRWQSQWYESLSLVEYLFRVECVIVEEQRREVDFLHYSTHEKLLRRLYAVLLINPQKKLLLRPFSADSAGMDDNDGMDEDEDSDGLTDEMGDSVTFAASSGSGKSSSAASTVSTSQLMLDESRFTDGRRKYRHTSGGVYRMCAMQRYSDLKRLYRLYSFVPKSLGMIASIIRERIKDELYQLMDSFDIDPCADVLSDPTRKVPPSELATMRKKHWMNFTPKLLEFYMKFRGMVDECFDGYSDFNKAIKHGFIDVLNNGSILRKHCELGVSELMVEFMDRVLRKDSKIDSENLIRLSLNSVAQITTSIRGGSKSVGFAPSMDTSSMSIEEYLRGIIDMYEYLLDKDKFLEYYRLLLAKRLLSDKCHSDLLEKQMILQLKLKSGAQLTSRLEGMLRDLQRSKDTHNLQFQAYLARGGPAAKSPLRSRPIAMPFEFSVNVLTSAFWPTATISTDTMKLQRLGKSMENVLSLFERYYSGIHERRSLKWIHSMGSVTLRANCLSFGSGGIGGTGVLLEVSTLQACVLLILNQIQEIKISMLIPMLGCDALQLKQSLKPLCSKKYRVLLKTPKLSGILCVLYSVEGIG